MRLSQQRRSGIPNLFRKTMSIWRTSEVQMHALASTRRDRLPSERDQRVRSTRSRFNTNLGPQGPGARRPGEIAAHRSAISA